MDTETEVRFGAVDRLYGPGALARLLAARVLVVGLGGVGSWVAEALARAGVGKLTLVDLDEVCESNINRQVHALGSSVGAAKVTVMKERIRDIHPSCAVTEEVVFFAAANADSLLGPEVDYVVDAIDTTKHKALLLAECRKRGLPVITSGGAGGRIDPTAIFINDLGYTRDDPLTLQLRKRLRREYGFPKGEKRKFHIPCVTSREMPRFPWVDGSVRMEREPGSDYRLNCDQGFGSVAQVTGAYGFAMAGYVIQALAEGLGKPLPG